MKVGVDLDGVLANFVKKYKEVMAQVTQTPTILLDNKFPVDWDWTNFKWSKNDHSKAWEIIKNTPNFWETLEILPGTELVDDLFRQHEVFFITTRVASKGKSVSSQSIDWLYRAFGLYLPTVLVSDNKGKLAEALGLKAFIDDKIENCQDIAKYIPNVYLCDASQNQGCKEFPRVANFDAFAGKIFSGELS